MKLHFLYNEQFRSNPLYQLKEAGSLHQSEQLALTGILSSQAEIYGVLMPIVTGTPLSTKLAYKDIALLFYSLQQPGSLPYFLKKIFDDDLNRMVAKLVMEDVLQIAYNGVFVSGHAATPAIYKDEKDKVSDHDHIALLSKKAIEYVLQLQVLNAEAAISKLYGYNTAPTLDNRFQFRSLEEIEQFLGLSPHTALPNELDQYWEKRLPDERFNWLTFSRRNNQAIRDKKRVTYKLYVSPAMTDLPAVYQKTARLLSDTNAFAFKCGATTESLLRPDKMVIYFHSFNDMEKAIDVLKEALTSFTAQGVPFTAHVDEKGILSWGIDPPQAGEANPVDGGSWRARVAELIGSAVMQAKANHLPPKDAYQFVINKLFLEKIDPYTWMPQHDMWN